MRLRTTFKLLFLVALASFVYGWYLFNEDRWGKKWHPADAVLPDNVKYYGELKDGLLEGPGELVGADGSNFNGSFRQGLLHGEGEMWDADFRYRGNFERGMFNGHGALEYTLGGSYEGQFRNNRMHGKGKLEYRDGSSFEGEFADNRMVRGIFKDNFGTYEGEFLNDLYHGKGVYISTDGTRYEGDFLQGQLTGHAIVTAPDESRYEGEVQDWNYHGKGVLKHADGSVYTGEFQDGVFHGQGELKLAEPINGLDVITGEWTYGFLKEDPRFEQPDHSALVEKLLYSQGDLLRQRAAGLTAGDPQKIEFYFLGVAGDGAQEIFLRELQFVSKLLEERLQMSQHQFLLANNRQSADVFPLVTRTAIERAVTAIRETMNVEQDILLTYLTSHGSDDHRFHIAMPGLELPSISKTELAEILSKSGIRWQVIIISACYSGGFIPELQNDSTLVITAARDDRQSFGCDDRNDMTYFARAYFKEAFAQSGDFIQSFDAAKIMIDEWENKDFPEDDHSEPQMFVGEKIKAHLDAWTEQQRAP